MVKLSNDLGEVIVDFASAPIGPAAPVNGELRFQHYKTYMDTSHNIRIKSDNKTTIDNLSNVTSAYGASKAIVQDPLTVAKYNTMRGNKNPAMETQLNLMGPVNTTQPLSLDKSKTTTRQTTLYCWNGGAVNHIPNQTVQSNYTTKDGSGGVTNRPANKDPVMGYMPGGCRVTGNMIHGTPGKVHFKEMDNDAIRTKGNGTLHQAVPELSRINPVLKEQTGTVQFNPNRIQQEDHTRTDCAMIDGLLTNGYSVYNKGEKYPLVYPSFNCNSRHSEYSPFKITQIKKEEIPDSNISVHNSHTNGNEVIVRNVTTDNFENPLLFTSREIRCSPSIHGKCY